MVAERVVATAGALGPKFASAYVVRTRRATPRPVKHGVQGQTVTLRRELPPAAVRTYGDPFHVNRTATHGLGGGSVDRRATVMVTAIGALDDGHGIAAVATTGRPGRRRAR